MPIITLFGFCIRLKLNRVKEKVVEIFCFLLIKFLYLSIFPTNKVSNTFSTMSHEKECLRRTVNIYFVTCFLNRDLKKR